MKLKIAILAGDGIGPEVTNEAVNILKAVAELGGHDFAFNEGLIGGVAITATGSPLPTATLDIALDSDAVVGLSRATRGMGTRCEPAGAGRRLGVFDADTASAGGGR